jgi:hypothetical protein
MTPLARLSTKWLLCGLGPVLLLFGLTAFIDSFGTALSVVTESESPYCLGRQCAHGGLEAELLAIGGYLLVPVLIGTLSAVVFDSQRRKHYLTQQDFERKWEEHVAQLPPGKRE